MADLSKTITNSVTVYGSKPTEKWDSSFLWGDNWDYGTEDLVQAVGKGLAQSLSITGTKTLQFGKHVIGGAIQCFGDMFSERVYDGVYVRLFNGSVKDGESRMTGSYTQVSPSSTTFTVISDPTTTWVEQ